MGRPHHATGPENETERRCCNGSTLDRFRSAWSGRSGVVAPCNGTTRAAFDRAQLTVLGAQRSDASGEVFGHRPAKGDDHVAVGSVERSEEQGHVGADRFRLGRLEVEAGCRLPFAADDERTIVDPMLGAEALGEPAAPGAFLPRRLVVGPRNDVFESLEGGEGDRKSVV